MAEHFEKSTICTLYSLAEMADKYLEIL